MKKNILCALLVLLLAPASAYANLNNAAIKAAETVDQETGLCQGWNDKKNITCGGIVDTEIDSAAEIQQEAQPVSQPPQQPSFRANETGGGEVLGISTNTPGPHQQLAAEIQALKKQVLSLQQEAPVTAPSQQNMNLTPYILFLTLLAVLTLQNERRARALVTRMKTLEKAKIMKKPHIKKQKS